MNHISALNLRPGRFLLFAIVSICVALALPLAKVKSSGDASKSVSKLKSSPPQRTLSMQQRIAYQRLIEEVYWQHRIWPKENHQAKPSLEEVIPTSAIEEKVKDYLRKSQALEDYWQRPITAEQLQTEIERMASQSRQPELLKELWTALGNDAFLIAECLARPMLVERLTQNYYAFDERFHGALKKQVTQDSQLFSSPASLAKISGKYTEEEWLKSDRQTPGKVQTDYLKPSEWDSKIDELSNEFGEAGNAARDIREKLPANVTSRQKNRSDITKLESIPVGVAGKIQENRESFYITTVIKKHNDSIKVAHVVWIKKSFDDWWEEEKEKIFLSLEIPRSDYSLVALSSASTCTDDTWSMLKSGPPLGRDSHTAVWTGSEMIVWGGFVASSPSQTNTGGRYNPATDTWLPTSTLNAPTARTGHTAVWTGSEMIIWGEFSNTLPGPTNTGGRYNPSIDSWTPTSVTNAPAARNGHTAVWTGSEMIIWGGEGANTGGRYNPSTDTWTPTSTLNAPDQRIYHQVVWTGSQMIVWGGIAASPGFVNTGGRYDPATDTWIPTSTTNTPTFRNKHVAVWSGSEMLLWSGNASAAGGRYNPVTDTWAVMTTVNAPSDRASPAAVWTGSEMIVWGGDTFNNSGGKYNPATNTWTATSTTNAPTSRTNPTAIWTGTEMIVWGGSYSETGGRYNPVSNSWVPTSVIPERRRNHTAVWTGTEMIIWGGFNNTYLFTGIRYNPATETWTETSNNFAARASHTAVWTGTRMIIWGGEASGGTLLNTGSSYNPSTNTWDTLTTSNAPVARKAHSVLWTGTDMVIWGGLGTSGLLDSGALYNPSADTWTATSSTSAPSPRTNHTAVWTGNAMIVWGGTNAANQRLNSGANYNPVANSWQNITTSGAPAGRELHTAIWTGSEMMVWGGFNGANQTNSGGLYNPANNSWRLSDTTTAPSARSSHTAIWTGNHMIIWGGSDGLNALNSGGRYNPVSNLWQSTSLQNAPAARIFHTAIWTGNQMLIWGGKGNDFESTNTGLAYCAPASESDVSVSVAPLSSPIEAGANVTYTITVTNNGPGIAVSVNLNHVLAPSLTFISCSSTGGGICSGTVNNRIVTFTQIPAMTSATINIVAQVPCNASHSATINAQTSVTSSSLDSMPANNSASSSFTVANSTGVSPTSQSYGANGGTGSISVTVPGTCAWTAASNDNWITITSGASGSGNGTVNYSVGINSSLNPRTGTMTIAGQTFTINQSGVSCAYAISPVSRAHTAGTGADVVVVTAPAACNWTAASNAPWITITSGSSGAGNGTVGYSLIANATGSPRSGTLTIAGQTFTVNQAAVAVAVNKPFDFDGDGKVDVAVWRPTSGSWFINNSSSGATTFVWGISGDVPVAADYDGDGKTDIAVWRPSNGTWYINYSSNGALVVYGWGLPTDKAVPADYDGDGKADVAVWRPSTGTWYIRNSSNGALVVIGWGANGDVPVSGRP